MANIVILSGRITKEPELKYTSSDEPKAYVKFSLAVEKPQRGTGADFITCTVWGKSAENFSKWVTKGSMLVINGRWTTGAYNGKNGKVFTNECTVTTWEMFGGKRSGEEDNSDNLAENGADSSIPGGLDFLNSGIDDVPFN